MQRRPECLSAGLAAVFQAAKLGHDETRSWGAVIKASNIKPA
jgi:hypothetical protein